MGADPALRGGLAVTQLGAMDPREAALVRAMRTWFDGPDGQAEVWTDVAARLGSRRGRAALAAFEALLDLMVSHGRRPLMRHRTGCACVGADEAVFAHFVTTAASGDREDALLMATLLVEIGMAPRAVALAQRVGLDLRRVADTRPRPAPAMTPSPTRH